MLRWWRHSLIHATLLRIALGAVLLAAAGTFVTYRLLFQAIEERAVINLGQYVAERARREEIQFDGIIANLNVAARAFLERYEEVDPPGYLSRWEELVERGADGAWRSPRARFDGTRDTTIWAHRDVPLTEELMRRTIILFDVHEKLRPAWISSFRSLWACTPEMTNIGFDPLIPNWVYNTPADWAQNEAEWVSVATPERNPERKIVWTYSIIEDISREYFVSVCLPVYLDNRHVATFGHDVRVFRLIERSVQYNVDGMTHMMVRDDGRIIAHPDKRQEIMESQGSYSVADDPVLAQLFQNLSGRRVDQAAGYDAATGLYYAARRLQGPDWLFVTTLPRAVIARDAFSHARWILWSGGASVVVLLGLLAVTLRRGIARPLAELTQATNRLSAGESSTAISVMRNDELGQLATAFNRMTEKIAARDAAMRELNADLERRITERTGELQTSESRVRAMLENTPGAIVVIDAQTTRFVAANEIAVRSLGLDRQRISAFGPLDVSPAVQENGQPSSAVLREAMSIAREGRVASLEWLHRGAAGGTVPCEVRLSRLPDKDRDLVIATIIDITPRKEAEARLLETLEHERELNELKTNFVSMVSHEFRTPLGIISSSAEILRRYYARIDAATREEHLDTIVRSTRVLGTMMEEVLLLGRFEAGRMQFTPKPVDLEALCRALAAEVEAATDHACAITVTRGGGLTGAQSDEFLLRHIFTNLLSNAVKYSPPGSPVTFALERYGSQVIFRVQDRGIGIPAEDMRTMFQAFRRGRNVGQRPGSGLGLVIVQRCVQLHGGMIQVGSEPGQGTVVTVRLPLFAADRQVSAGVAADLDARPAGE